MKNISITIIMFAAFLVLNSCALFVRPPVEPTLEHMADEDIYSYVWEDDLDYEGLRRALEHSKRYYKQLPSSRTFHYAEYTYSPEEMIDSLDLFLNIVGTFKGHERVVQLKKKFLFFESKNAAGEAFFTGYYEPLLNGSLEPTQEFQSPVYTTPADLIEADLGQFREKWKHEKIVGRLRGDRLVPYDSREEIVYNASLKNRITPIAYVKEIELFFLQIQGSGLIRLQDGSLKRLNYASQNGHPYRPIGKILKNKISEDEMSMQSIKAYLYAHPAEVREILSYNQSYVFFREVDEGPLGDIEVPLTPGRSIAMDRRVVPRGGLAFIETEIPIVDNGEITGLQPLRRFVIVQDTGGAIRGHGRVDIFFGYEKNAEMIAGHLKQKGRVFLLVARKEFLK